MKIGVFTTMDRVDNSSIKEWLEILVSCEDMGYNSLWLAELHFNQNSFSSTPALILASLASKTSKIKLAYGVKLLAFHNPLLIAEELSTLQYLSDNRIIFGVGKGTPLSIQDARFGIERENLRDYMYESLDIMHSLWENSELSPEPSFDFPQTVIASFAQKESLELIINSKHALLLGSPFQVEVLQKSLKSLNKPKPSLYLTRFCVVDKDHKKARRRAEPFLKEWLEKASKSALFSNISDPLDMLMSTSLIGDASFVQDQLQRYKELLMPKEILVEPIDKSLKEKRATLEAISSLLS